MPGVQNASELWVAKASPGAAQGPAREGIGSFVSISSTEIPAKDFKDNSEMGVLQCRVPAPPPDSDSVGLGLAVPGLCTFSKN